MRFYTKRRRNEKAKRSGIRDLPENAMTEIMSWLPPESLVQCKLVNKSWCSMIDKLINNMSWCSLIDKHMNKNQWFVSKHLENFGSRSSTLLFFRGEELPDHSITDNQLLTSYNYVSDENDDEQIQFNSQSLAIMCMSMPRRVEADYRTTHCNGIIFQTENNTNEIWLWNPTTKLEFRLLKNPSSCFSKFGFRTFAAGLGYDAINKIHKVVRVVILSSCFAAEICNLDSKPRWREISMMMIKKGDHYTASNGVYHRGLLYWLINHEKTASPNERMMISFDMHSEKFRKVSMPSDVVNKPMEFNSISTVSVGEDRVTTVKMGLWFGVWNERPTLLKYVNETIPLETQGISRPVEMWTLKKEEKRYWVKHNTFSPRLKRFQPIAFWKTDELLLGTCEKDHIVSYNLRTRKIRTVQLSSQTLSSFSYAFSYVKSLVSFDYY